MSGVIAGATVWLILAFAMAALILYRKLVSGSEDDSLHVMEAEASTVAHQSEVAMKLEVIDKWGKLLTVIVAIGAFVLAGAYVYVVWTQSATSVVG